MRIRTRRGRVLRVLSRRPGITELEVEVAGEAAPARAFNYEELTGPVGVGDTVILNTTAVALGLGSGGAHFVMWVEGREYLEASGPGHIMKLRYTPWQIRCLAAEEEVSPFRREIEAFRDLGRLPVVIGTLHSMLPAMAMGAKLAGAGVRSWGELAALLAGHDQMRQEGKGKPPRVIYLMTDGAALPLAFSRLVAELRARSLLDGTITVGHAFGGDLEAVNVYSGLVAARQALKADLVLVAMGPGIVGTGTKYGFTGLEQGEIVNAVSILGGTPVAVPRLSFADPRPRHRGVSHHTLTALGEVALRQALLALPRLHPAQAAKVREQLTASGITARHELREVEAGFVLEALRAADLEVTTMGRGLEEERAFFLAAAAGGVLAGELFAGGGG